MDRYKSALFCEKGKLCFSEVLLLLPDPEPPATPTVRAILLGAVDDPVSPSFSEMCCSSFVMMGPNEPCSRLGGSMATLSDDKMMMMMKG